MATRIKKDDEVVVISGRDKGARGRVLKVIRDKDQVIVEGVGRVKKHQKPNQKNPQGGITEKDFTLARKIEDAVLWRPEAGGPLEGTPNKFVRGG